MHIAHPQRLAPFARFAAVAAAIATVAACGDPLGPRASLAVQNDTLVAFALSGTPPSAPAALNTAFRTVVRADASYAYDVAFDLTTDGQVRLIPVRLLGGVATSNKRVGIQKGTQPFDAITKAPSGGYQYDSVVVVRPGEAVLIEVLSEQCVYTLSSFLYSKIVVDSVQTGARKIFFRLTHDPNCGFRSFKPGVPKD